MFTRLVLATLVGVCAASSAVRAQEDRGSKVDLTVLPCVGPYLLGRPVLIPLSFVNNGDRKESIDLGAEGLANIELSIAGLGRETKVARYQQSGFQVVKRLEIEPRKAVTYMFLLDRVYRIKESGSYTISISIGGTGRKPIGAKAEIAVFNSEKEYLDKLFAEMKNEKTLPWRREELFHYFAALRSPEYVNFNIDLMKLYGRTLSFELQEANLVSIIETKDAKAFAYLADEILGAKNGDKNLRRLCLYLLSANNEWKQEKNLSKLLAPFAQEISEAVPIGADD